MKLSGIKAHRTYRPDYSTFVVICDGEIVRDCLFADDQAGRVITAVLDAERNCLRPNRNGSGPQLAERRGKVVIAKTSLPLTERYTDAFLAMFSKETPIVRPH